MISPISLRVVIQNLEGLDLLLGMFLLGAGLVFMVLGFHMFKTLVALSFGIIGFSFGCCLPIDVMFQLSLGIALALVLAAASIYFVKMAVATLAGGWTATVTFLVALQMHVRDELTLTLSILVFAAVVSLTFVLYQEIIAAVMSFEGTLLFLSGMVIVLSGNSRLWGYFRALMLDTPLFMFFTLMSGTVIGFYLQVAEMQKKHTGTSG